MSQGWIPLAEADRWRGALDGIPHRFTHLPEYSAAAAITTGHEAGLWHWEGAGGRAACPLLRRAAPGRGFDLVSPAGFAGFALLGDAQGMAQAWTGFWREHGALAAYVQLSPSLDAEEWRAALPELERHLQASRQCWMWDLQPSPSNLEAALAPKHRQLLHKWQRESGALCWDRTELQAAFDRLYGDFCKRRGVGRAYRFTPTAIAALSASPGALWIGARGPAGDIEAVMLFLWHQGHADSFLAASTPAGRVHSRALYWQGALRLRELGARWLNLGGGLVDGDELARFKQRFGARACATLALKQVIDPDGFAAACTSAGVAPDACGRFPPWLDA